MCTRLPISSIGWFVLVSATHHHVCSLDSCMCLLSASETWQYERPTASCMVLLSLTCFADANGHLALYQLSGFLFIKLVIVLYFFALYTS